MDVMENKTFEQILRLKKETLQLGRILEYFVINCEDKGDN